MWEENKIIEQTPTIRFKSGHGLSITNIPPASSDEVYLNYPLLFNYYLAREKSDGLNGVSGHDSNSM